MEYRAEKHQISGINFITRTRRCIICTEPGTGKLSMVLSALYSLKYDYFEENKIVIVSQKTNVILRWIPELRKWNHLKGLSYAMVFNNTDSDSTNWNNCDIVFTSYKYMHQILKESEHMRTTVVLDEAHNYCCYYRKAYDSLKKDVEHLNRLILICDCNVTSDLGLLWDVTYLADSGMRLGSNRNGFIDRYCYHYSIMRNGKKVNVADPKPGSWGKIREKVSDICFYNGGKRYIKKEFLVFNRYISMNRDAYSKYLLAKRIADIAVSISDDGQADHYKRIASQYADGIVQRDDGTVSVIHAGKINELRRLINSMPFSRIMICVPFEFECGIISDVIPGIDELDSFYDYDRWDASGKYTAVICSENKDFRDVLSYFNNGVLITFRDVKNNVIDMGIRRTVNVCSILIGDRNGW